jgi:hypothetical protein
MCVKSLIKRIAPFFLTFVVGLFIASFFVSVVAPNFQFRGGFNGHRERDRQMRCENQRLREENERLRNRLNEMEDSDWVINPDINVPPPPVAPSMPMKTVPYKAR